MATAHANDRAKPALAAEQKGSGWLRYVFIAFVLVCAVGAGFWWAHHGDKRTQGAEPTPLANATLETEADDAPRVQVVHPRRGGRPRTTVQPGSLHAFEYADIYAKVSGYLKEQSVDYGSRVKKGELLAVIDDPEVLQEAAQAEANVRLAKEQVKQTEALVKSTEAERDVDVAAVARAKADILKYTAARVFAEKRFARYKGLVARKAIDEELVDEEQDRYESALAAERAAQASLQSAQAQVTAAEARIVKAKADLGEATANVDVEEAKLAKANVLAEYTKIVSPYAGVVTRRTFHPGAFIRSESAGDAEPLFRVARTDKMRVAVRLPDIDVPYTDLKDPAIVTFATLSNRQFKGEVARIAEAQDPETRTMYVEVFLDNTDGVLREGMYCNVEIILAPASENVTIPSTCLVGNSGAGKGTVWVVKDDKALMRAIRIGYDNGVDVDVLEGLSTDDKVILPHNVALAEGETLTIEETPEPSAVKVE
jgi:HlyD family secretion protein